MTPYDLARHLHAQGFCVLPLAAGGKRPARKWKHLQSERPTEDDLIEWFVDCGYEVGIVTGAISGITVIDCDSLEAAQAASKAGLHSLLTQQTKRGIHLVYRHGGERNTVRVGGMAGVDRRGEGGYVRAYPDAARWTRRDVDEARALPGSLPCMSQPAAWQDADDADDGDAPAVTVEFLADFLGVSLT